MLTPRFRFCPSVNASPASLGRPVAMSTSPRLVKLLAKPSWDWGPSSNGAENNAKPSSLLDRPLRDLLSLPPLEVLLVVDVCEHSYMAVHRSNPRCRHRLPQHRLNFSPLPHGQGEFRPVFCRLRVASPVSLGDFCCTGWDFRCATDPSRILRRAW